MLPRLEHDISRRTAIQAGSIGLLGLGMNHVSALRAADQTTVRPGHGRAKSVIFIFLSGGLTQHDSFDPKPDAPSGIRGEFSPMATRTVGVHVCEHLPMLAERSPKWSMIRSLTTPYNEHSQGHMAILSGRTPMAAGFNPNRPSPGDHPSIASVIGGVVPARNNNLPPAVVLPERLIHRTGRVIPGQFGGLMGARRDPWFIEASPFNSRTYGAYPDYEFHFVRGRERSPDLRFQAPNLSLPQGLTRAQLSQRDGLRAILDQQRRSLDRAASTESFDRHRQAASSLLTDSRVQRAFDVESACPRLLDRYGRNAFGWSLLMARQLVEAGVTLVQVNLGNNETWDTHENNFPLLKDCLLPPTDRAVSALIDDLDARGLLDETLIVMCGEMGRTPRVNAGNGQSKVPGRDHWGAVQTVFLAGGAIRQGIVVGASDRNGAYPSQSPQRPGEPGRHDLPCPGHSVVCILEGRTGSPAPYLPWRTGGGTVAELNRSLSGRPHQEEKAVEKITRRRALHLGALSVGAAVASSVDGAEPKPRIKIGQIGVGHAHASKLSVYRASPDYEVVGIVEPDEALRNSAADAAPYKGLNWLSREQLLATPGLQAVLVEARVRDLLDHAEACVVAGKHVHIDKPAGESLPQLMRIHELAAAKKLVVQMGYMYRYNPAVVLLRHFVQQGWLGDVFEVHAVMSKVVDPAGRKQLAEYKGGIMFELGCHVLDLVLGVLGRPQQVASFNRHSSTLGDGLVDNMLAVLSYPRSTATVKSTALEVDGFDRRHLVVCGTEGTFHIQPLDNPSARVSLSRARGTYRKGTQEIKFPKYARYVDDAADMARVIRGEKSFDFTAEHDLAVQETLLRACELPLDR